VPDFRVADAEFDSQAAILEALLLTVSVCSGQDPRNPTLIQGNAIPILPPGGQNTMASSAIVLLASHFEEYVRQQIEEYARSVVQEYNYLKDEFKESLVSAYWRSGCAKLDRMRPKGDPLWVQNVEPMLRGLLVYPVGEDVNGFLASFVSSHENNMRWEVILELAARVGVKKLSDRLFRSAQLKTALGSPRKEDFSAAMRLRLNEFYSLRNAIVHSISQNVGVGPSVLHQWTAFLRTLTTAMAVGMEASFAEFDVKIASRKAAVAGP
jgi:hypothetical protein